MLGLLGSCLALLDDKSRPELFAKLATITMQRNLLMNNIVAADAMILASVDHA